MQTANNMAETVKSDSGYSMTDHAWRRMTSRGLSQRAVEAVLTYGRTVHARGAEIHALGRREVEKYSTHSMDLHPFTGVQVVCLPEDEVILTVYRNNDFNGLFKRNPRRGRQRHSGTRNWSR
jgi:hypothetical protein